MPYKEGLGSKRGSIQFVNAWPSSEPERLQLENSVRAHVGEWNSRQSSEQPSPTVPPQKRKNSDDRVPCVNGEQYDSSSSQSSNEQPSQPLQLTPSGQQPNGFSGSGSWNMRAMAYAVQAYHNNSKHYSRSQILWATDWLDRHRRPTEFIDRLGSSFNPFAVAPYYYCPDALQFAHHYS